MSSSAYRSPGDRRNRVSVKPGTVIVNVIFCQYSDHIMQWAVHHPYIPPTRVCGLPNENRMERPGRMRAADPARHSRRATVENGPRSARNRPFRTVLLIVALAVLTACSHRAGSSEDEQLVSVIVQAPTTEQAERAVALVGGTVTHRLGIIRSVGATVTGRQLELLGHIEGVQVHEDRSVPLTEDGSGGVTCGNGGSEPVGRQSTGTSTAGSGISNGA